MPYVIVNSGRLQGLNGFGAVAAPGMTKDPVLIQSAVVALVTANARAKELAQQVVAATGIVFRSTAKEWAATYTATVEGMVVKLLTPSADGTYTFQKNAALLTVVADFVEEAAKDQIANISDNLSVGGTLTRLALAAGAGLRDAALALTRAGVEMAIAAANAALDSFKKDPLGTSTALVGLAALAGGAFLLWRFTR